VIEDACQAHGAEHARRMALAARRHVWHGCRVQLTPKEPRRAARRRVRPTMSR
jgi:hypothetical protein